MKNWLTDWLADEMEGRKKKKEEIKEEVEIGMEKVKFEGTGVGGEGNSVNNVY